MQYILIGNIKCGVYVHIEHTIYFGSGSTFDSKRAVNVLSGLK